MNVSFGTNGSFPTSQLQVGHNAYPCPCHLHMGQVPHSGPGSSGAQNSIIFILLSSANFAPYNLDMNLEGLRALWIKSEILLTVQMLVGMREDVIWWGKVHHLHSWWRVARFWEIKKKFKKKREIQQFWATRGTTDLIPPSCFLLFYWWNKHFYLEIKSRIDELYFVSLIILLNLIFIT